MKRTSAQQRLHGKSRLGSANPIAGDHVRQCMALLALTIERLSANKIGRPRLVLTRRQARLGLRKRKALTVARSGRPKRSAAKS